MTISLGKAQSLWEFIEKKPITQTQENYKSVCQKDPPARNCILRWEKKSLETGNVVNMVNPGFSLTNNVDVERISKTFLHSPGRSAR